MSDYTFGGRISWNIAPQSLAVDLEASALERAIKTAIPDMPERQAERVQEFSIIYASTQCIEIETKTAKPVIKAFFAAWQKRDKMTPEQLWRWRVALPYSIWGAWQEAWQDSQSLFDTDPAELPTSALTIEQKAEAETTGTPLT